MTGAHRVRLALLISSFVLGALGCGKEVGRIPLTSETTAQAPMTLAAGEVAFWTDLDIEYEGSAALTYTVELVQDGVTVATAACDPLGHLPVKLGWLQTSIGGEQTRRGNGKMSCNTTLAKGGATTVKATLAFSRKPARATLRRADLVVKQ